jgi:hypothetical protein
MERMKTAVLISGVFAIFTVLMTGCVSVPFPTASAYRMEIDSIFVKYHVLKRTFIKKLAYVICYMFCLEKPGWHPSGAGALSITRRNIYVFDHPLYRHYRIILSQSR